MDEWDQYLRRLTLERQRGMPRWHLTPAPERIPRASDDSPNVVAQRRKGIEALEDEEKSQRRHLRRIA